MPSSNHYITSVSKKLGQTTVVIQYSNLSRFFFETDVKFLKHCFCLWVISKKLLFKKIIWENASRVLKSTSLQNRRNLQRFLMTSPKIQTRFILLLITSPAILKKYTELLVMWPIFLIMWPIFLITSIIIMLKFILLLIMWIMSR